MFETPANVLEFFFEVARTKGKYKINVEENSALIKPRLEEEYYKPVIIIKDLNKFKIALENFICALNNFYRKNNNLQVYHNLEYFFSNLFFNMTTSDALDFTEYVNRRSYFLLNQHFQEFDTPQLLFSASEINIYAERILEEPGLETPYVLSFWIEIEKNKYQLPLIRYAIDENNVCHLFSIQYGRNRSNDIPDIFKTKINQVNRGVKKYRNVSPTFVIVFRLFLQILKNKGIQKIKVPDFLFGRYKHYYRAQGTNRSDEILERILNKFLILLKRMEYQFSIFKIDNYPNEIDSYTHISLKK